MDDKDLNEGLKKYKNHLLETAKVFNDWAKRKGVPVRMDPRSAIKAVTAGIGLARIAPHWSQAQVDDTGIVHESQLKTAIDCLVELLRDQKRCGHVLGAMQSGKTTTSLALQWAGPVVYLLTGTRVYPFYIISSQTNHEDQTRVELERFLTYYGNVEIFATSKSGEPTSSLNAVFARSPSLLNYREEVLRDVGDDVFDVPQLEDLVHRRVGGEQSVGRIVDLCQRASNRGYRSLMIIDEPQFGASDRIVTGDAGPIRQPCVLVQIFDRIERALGSKRLDHWFVGLSATPFELNDLDRVWEVRQYLTEKYSGFNFFNGRPIAENVNIVPPATMGLTEFADEFDVSFADKISMAAYDGGAKSFERHAKKISFEDDQATYQIEVEKALREAVYKILDDYGDMEEPVGLCVRAFNDNTRTERFIERLALDSELIEVIRYYGPDSTGVSVKRRIAMRKRSDLPYIVFVTNRARMADAFPVQVRFFMDFAQKASDLNALLQGLLGRACGYGKKSTVVLSDTNALIVKAYIDTTGGYVHKTSRHSVAVGGFRRGAPTGMLKLRVEMDDPVVRSFFAEIDKQVVRPNIRLGSTKLSGIRNRTVSEQGYRTGPILNIAESLRLFDHIEQADVRKKIFPQIPTGFKVARAGDEVTHVQDSAVKLKYSLDRHGNCRFTFRWLERESAAKGGAPGRSKGKKDTGQHMEPTVYVEKFDPKTNKIIDDRDADDGKQRPGAWRAFMVTFPLRKPVREIRPAQLAYPTPLSPYDEWMDADERTTRDRELNSKKEKKTGIRDA
ncbi:MAG TPA: hypothetical protein VK539_06900 [Myxococcaceae bacterium]|nr:hypothetical protein [Myxococcaceae bacterium]